MVLNGHNLACGHVKRRGEITLESEPFVERCLSVVDRRRSTSVCVRSGRRSTLLTLNWDVAAVVSELS